MIKFAHSSARGHGAQLMIDIVPDDATGEAGVLVSMWRQDGQGFTPDDSWSITLTPTQTMHFVNFMRNREDTLNLGKGIMFRDKDGRQFRMYGERTSDPFEGYQVDLRAFRGNESLGRRRIVLNKTEADLVASSLLAMAGMISFGLM